MKNSKSKKRKSPPRQRYEVRNPVISFRVTKEVKDRAQGAKEKEDMSHLDIYKKGLGIKEVKIRTEKEIWQKAYDEGRDSIIDEAAEIFSVYYPCSKCGKEILVDTEEEKQAIRQYMFEHGWGHTDCPPKK